MRTRKWAKAIAVTALALGLIGAGVAAQFSDSASATHRIDVGVLDVSLASDTPGAVVTDGGQTLTCPAILIDDSAADWFHPQGACHIQIVKAADSIDPDRVDLKVAVWTNGADLTKFMAQFNEGAGLWSPNMYGYTPMLNTLDGSVLTSTSVLPADMYTNLGWLELGNTEMGKTVIVTYTIEAVA
jgi:predicted ribosomally synthesized peptide with SipW-like signal peptide